ncbi:MAG: hypothetical protein FWD86_03125 [Firmicutes bacterium]|nr:hypothetical protein [Bacillota bacterium]
MIKISELIGKQAICLGTGTSVGTVTNVLFCDKMLYLRGLVLVCEDEEEGGFAGNNEDNKIGFAGMSDKKCSDFDTADSEKGSAFSCDKGVQDSESDSVFLQYIDEADSGFCAVSAKNNDDESGSLSSLSTQNAALPYLDEAIFCANCKKEEQFLPDYKKYLVDYKAISCHSSDCVVIKNKECLTDFCTYGQNLSPTDCCGQIFSPIDSGGQKLSQTDGSGQNYSQTSGSGLKLNPINSLAFGKNGQRLGAISDIICDGARIVQFIAAGQVLARGRLLSVSADMLIFSDLECVGTKAEGVKPKGKKAAEPKTRASSVKAKDEVKLEPEAETEIKLKIELKKEHLSEKERLTDASAAKKQDCSAADMEKQSGLTVTAETSHKSTSKITPIGTAKGSSAAVAVDNCGNPNDAALPANKKEPNNSTLFKSFKDLNDTALLNSDKDTSKTAVLHNDKNLNKTVSLDDIGNSSKTFLLNNAKDSSKSTPLGNKISDKSTPLGDKKELGGATSFDNGKNAGGSNSDKNDSSKNGNGSNSTNSDNTKNASGSNLDKNIKICKNHYCKFYNQFCRCEGGFEGDYGMGLGGGYGSGYRNLGEKKDNFEGGFINSGERKSGFDNGGGGRSSGEKDVGFDIGGNRSSDKRKDDFGGSNRNSDKIDGEFDGGGRIKSYFFPFKAISSRINAPKADALAVQIPKRIEQENTTVLKSPCLNAGEQAKFSFLKGKAVQRDIYCANGQILARCGAVIDQGLIVRAKNASRLVQLALHSV